MSELAISVSEFCRRLSIGRTKAYQLISTQDVQALKIGRRTLITVRSVEAMVERLTSGGGSQLP